MATMPGHEFDTPSISAGPELGLFEGFQAAVQMAHREHEQVIASPNAQYLDGDPSTPSDNEAVFERIKDGNEGAVALYAIMTGSYDRIYAKRDAARREAADAAAESAVPKTEGGATDAAAAFPQLRVVK